MTGLDSLLISFKLAVLPIDRKDFEASYIKMSSVYF